MKKKMIPFAVAGSIIFAANGAALAASGDDVLQFGSQYLGKPYTYGAAIGDTSRFDCSSFTATVFQHYGINLPRVSYAQATVGTSVERNALQKGDLVFFDVDHDGVIDHVGIYAGNNKMISALVSSGIAYSDITSSYWAPTYVTARRVLDNASTQPGTGTSTGSTSGKVYTVQSGDSLWLISVKYNVSIADLKSWNHLTSDMIYPGQQLTVSGTKATAPQGGSGSATKNGNTGGTSNSSTVSTYTVKSGDTLWDIAVKYHLTVAKLKEMNQLKSDVIYPGQKLRVGQNSASQTQGDGSAKKNPKGESGQSSTTKQDVYIVKPNDSLWGIATSHKMTVSALKQLNHLNSDIIYPGDKLIFNANTSNVNKVDKPKEPVKYPTPKYTVKKGDTLWDIALLYDTTVKKLMKANNLPTSVIFPGQVLTITR